MKMMGMDDMKKQVEIETPINGDSTLKILGKRLGGSRRSLAKQTSNHNLGPTPHQNGSRPLGEAFLPITGTLEGWSLAIDTCTVNKDMSSLGASTLAGS